MSNVSLVNGHIDEKDTCVCCGNVIPEGRQVCLNCEEKENQHESKTTSKQPHVKETAG